MKYPDDGSADSATFAMWAQAPPEERRGAEPGLAQTGSIWVEKQAFVVHSGLQWALGTTGGFLRELYTNLLALSLRVTPGRCPALITLRVL